MPSNDKIRIIKVPFNALILDIQLRDDGYRIYAKTLPDGIEVVWAEYKHCLSGLIGECVSNFLMADEPCSSTP